MPRDPSVADPSPPPEAEGEVRGGPPETASSRSAGAAADATRRLQTALVLLGLGLVVVLVWRVAQILLVIFAAILMTLILDGLVRLVRARLPVPRLAALIAVLIASLAVLGLFGAVGGPQLAEQVVQLGERLPEAVGSLQAQLRETSWGRLVLRESPAPSELLGSATALLGRVPAVFSNVTGVVTNAFFILLIGIYATVDPSLYVNGLVRLVPPGRRERAREVLHTLGHALRWWLIGRIASMTVVGVLTALGLWIVGLPLAFALGAIAGLFSFVPFVGPIVAVVPALLVSATEGLVTTLQVVAVYMGVQFLEGNFITPLIQQRVVALPPAALLTSQLVMGLLFGLVGVLLATPLTVALIVLVQTLYVRGALGDDSVEVLGGEAG